MAAEREKAHGGKRFLIQIKAPLLSHIDASRGPTMALYTHSLSANCGFHPGSRSYWLFSLIFEPLRNYFFLPPYFLLSSLAPIHPLLSHRHLLTAPTSPLFPKPRQPTPSPVTGELILSGAQKTSVTDCLPPLRPPVN